MDAIDRQILEALEKDSRISLKSLSNELGIKTSSLYHRLHRLKESQILKQYTIIIDPKAVGFNIFYLLGLRIIPPVIKKMDMMFLESFAEYLTEHYEQIQFSAIGSDDQIWVLCAFPDYESFESFYNNLMETPYIESINKIQLTNIMKGNKLFKITSDLISIQEDNEYFDNAIQGDNNLDDFDDEPEDKEIYF